MDMKGKMLAKQVNSKQLKLYNERKVVKKIDKLELNIGKEQEHTLYSGSAIDPNHKFGRHILLKTVLHVAVLFHMMTITKC